MSIDHEKTWKCIDCFPLIRRCWDHDTVVYHSGSGDIHVLNAVAAEALTLLARTPCTLPRLARQMAESQGRSFDEKWLGQVARLVETFDQVGLVEPCRS